GGQVRRGRRVVAPSAFTVKSCPTHQVDADTVHEAVTIGHSSRGINHPWISGIAREFENHYNVVFRVRLQGGEIGRAVASPATAYKAVFLAFRNGDELDIGIAHDRLE